MRERRTYNRHLREEDNFYIYRMSNTISVVHERFELLQRLVY